MADVKYQDQEYDSSFSFDHLNLRLNKIEERICALEDRKNLAKRRHHATVIQKFSTLIEKGVPSIYQLPVQSIESDPESQLSKVTIVPAKIQSDLCKPDKILILVGAIGAGKTTLINVLANYVYGVAWNDSFRFKTMVENTNIAESHSQTKFITAYKFQSTNLDYDLTVIDTPGFEDTDGGIDNNCEITKQFHVFFSKYEFTGINQLHGVGFVMQAPLASLTALQKYTLHAILSIFGKNVKDNIFFMTSFADTETPAVLAAVEDTDILYREFFKFNNSALFVCNECLNSDFTEMFWRMSLKSCEKFFSYFSQLSRISLTMTKEVLQERETLRTLVVSLHKEIKIGLSCRCEIEEQEKALKQYEVTINATKDFNYSIKVVKVRRIYNPGICYMRCLVCNMTCHNDCAVYNDSEKYQCWAMQEGRCIICPRKCHWMEHVVTPYGFEYYEDYETRTNQSEKDRFEEAQTGKIRSESAITRKREALNKTLQEALGNIKLIRNCIDRLKEIALKPNPWMPVEHIEMLIKSEEYEHKLGWKKLVTLLQSLCSNSVLLEKIQTSEIPEIEDLFHFFGVGEDLKSS